MPRKLILRVRPFQNRPFQNFTMTSGTGTYVYKALTLVPVPNVYELAASVRQKSSTSLPRVPRL
jgi:hypothetical protein